MFNTGINTNTKIVLLDVVGKTLLTTEINEGSYTIIPVNDLATGVYFIRIQQGKNTVTKKFIKE